MKPQFITFEGVDGAGKSTHLRWFAGCMEARGIAFVLTREPGGTPLGERVRELLLQPGAGMDPVTETLLMFAARREHLARVIRPALAQGRWVLCDRFTDATYAYQGHGRGVALERLRELEAWVQSGLRPDHTLLFDLAPELARDRAAAVRLPDRFEGEAQEFHRRVREGYLSLARAEPQRVHRIDAAGTPADIQKELEELFPVIGLS